MCNTRKLPYTSVKKVKKKKKRKGKKNHEQQHNTYYICNEFNKDESSTDLPSFNSLCKIYIIRNLNRSTSKPQS